MQNIQLTTNRIMLRNLETNDLDQLCKMFLNSKVTQYIDYIRKNNKEEVENWLNDTIKYNSEIPRLSYNLAVVENDSGLTIGWIGIGIPSNPSNGDLDFGYAIHEEYQGKGYGTETLKALIKFAFKQTDANKIFGECDKENNASAKIMLKCGLKLEEEYKESNGRTTLRFIIERLPIYRR